MKKELKILAIFILSAAFLLFSISAGAESGKAEKIDPKALSALEKEKTIEVAVFSKGPTCLLSQTAKCGRSAATISR